MYADFSFYQEMYRGTMLSKEDFEKFAPPAASYINNITCGRTENSESVPDSIKSAVCACAEVLFMRNFPSAQNIEQETVGRHSVRYSDSKTSIQAELYSAASLYLYNTGLLYRGI